MQRMFLRVLAIGLLITAASYGQSLGDVARENREKKSAEDSSSSSPPKVITNKDLQKNADADQEPAEDSKPNVEAPPSASTQRSAQRAAHRSAQQRLAEQRAMDQWKRLILAQKNRLTALQVRIDQLNETMRAAGGSVQYEPPYNTSQVRQLRRISQLQDQLDDQRIKLAEMQESARRAGMHTVVYDP